MDLKAEQTDRYELKALSLQEIKNDYEFLRMQIMAHLLGRNNTLEDPLAGICKEVISLPEFWQFPASLRYHHAYIGGLLHHTLEVVEFANNISEIASLVDRGILLSAAICHDISKIHEYNIYQEDGKWYANYKDDVRETTYHCKRSAELFEELAIKYKLDAKTTEAIHHCLLSHHGRKEWGIVEEPKTPEAYALHFCDMMSVHCVKQLF